MKNIWKKKSLKIFKGKSFPVVIAVVVIVALLFKVIADSQSKVDF